MPYANAKEIGKKICKRTVVHAYRVYVWMRMRMWIWQVVTSKTDRCESEREYCSICNRTNRNFDFPSQIWSKKDRKSHDPIPHATFACRIFGILALCNMCALLGHYQSTFHTESTHFAGEWKGHPTADNAIWARYIQSPWRSHLFWYRRNSHER